MATHPKEAEIYRLRSALNKARHSLVTLHNLTAADGAAPDETWTIDENDTITVIDEALRPHCCCDYYDDAGETQWFCPVHGNHFVVRL